MRALQVPAGVRLLYVLLLLLPDVDVQEDGLGKVRQEGGEGASDEATG